MELRDLKYFIKLVETRSYVQTANFFKISQPAISAMTKRLEAELNVKLIRTSKLSNFELTPSGLTLYRDAKELLSQYSSMTSEVIQANTNNFYLGYSELASKTWLAPVIRRFYKKGILKYVRARQFSSPILIKMLENKKFDAIIYSDLYDSPLSTAMLTTVLRVLQLKYYISPRNPLANKEAISFDDVKNQTIITYDHNYLGREGLEILVRKANCKLNCQNLIVIDSIDTIIDLVRENIGITIFPDIGIDYRDLKIIKPVKNEQVRMNLKLGIRRDLIPNEKQLACINAIKDLM